MPKVWPKMSQTNFFTFATKNCLKNYYVIMTFAIAKEIAKAAKLLTFTPKNETASIPCNKN